MITLKVLERIAEVPFKDITRVAVIVVSGLIIVYAIGAYKDEDKIFIYNLIFILVYCIFAAGYGVKTGLNSSGIFRR